MGPQCRAWRWRKHRLEPSISSKTVRRPARKIGAGLARRWVSDRCSPGPSKKLSREWGEGHARYSFGSNSRVRARRARRELEWAPKHVSLTDWIEHEMPVI